MIPAIVAASLISGGAGIVGGLLNRPKNPQAPPPPPDYSWISSHGPEIWNKLQGYGQGLMDNPYGLGDIRGRMMTTARDTATAGYEAGVRGVNQSAALAGLSSAGGTASRQQYYSQNQAAQNLSSAYANIDIQDYLAKEEQRNRGANLLFSLSNKSPVYSQIVAQNYWNELNAANEQAMYYQNMFGQIGGNLASAYLDYKTPRPQSPSYNWDMTNPYVNQGGGGYQFPTSGYPVQGQPTQT